MRRVVPARNGERPAYCATRLRKAATWLEGHSATSASLGLEGKCVPIRRGSAVCHLPAKSSVMTACVVSYVLTSGGIPACIHALHTVEDAKAQVSLAPWHAR
jgi:hypothetical protein